MSIMEAEAIGRCVITTDNVGCRECVKDGYNGFLVKTKDYTKISEKCIMILNDKEMAKKLGFNSRKFAEDKFDQRNINDYIVSVIKNES